MYVELKKMASFSSSVDILELDHSQQENKIHSSPAHHHRIKEKLHGFLCNNLCISQLLQNPFHSFL